MERINTIERKERVGEEEENTKNNVYKEKSKIQSLIM